MKEPKLTKAQFWKLAGPTIAAEFKADKRRAFRRGILVGVVASACLALLLMLTGCATPPDTSGMTTAPAVSTKALTSQLDAIDLSTMSAQQKAKALRRLIEQNSKLIKSYPGANQ